MLAHLTIAFPASVRSESPERVLRASGYTTTAVSAVRRGEPVGPTIALLDPQGLALGPILDEAGFCTLAASGAAVVIDAAQSATYRVVGTARSGTAFCGRYFSRLNRKQPVAAGALGRSRFERIDWPHGIGVLDYKLVPMRSIAANRLAHPPGTVYFAAQLAGRELADGSIHDGYLVVTDSLDTLAPERIEIYLGVAGRALPATAVPAELTVRSAAEPEAARAREGARWQSARSGR